MKKIEESTIKFTDQESQLLREWVALSEGKDEIALMLEADEQAKVTQWIANVKTTKDLENLFNQLSKEKDTNGNTVMNHQTGDTQWIEDVSMDQAQNGVTQDQVKRFLRYRTQHKDYYVVNDQNTGNEIVHELIAKGNPQLMQYYSLRVQLVGQQYFDMATGIKDSGKAYDCLSFMATETSSPNLLGADTKDYQKACALLINTICDSGDKASVATLNYLSQNGWAWIKDNKDLMQKINSAMNQSK